MSPTWSPDGRQLAFVSQRNGRLELFTMSADGSSQQVAASMPDASLIDPRWSPDGTRIAFVSVPAATGADKKDQPYAIFVLDVASRKMTRVSP
jgi:TolB protein